MQCSDTKEYLFFLFSQVFSTGFSTTVCCLLVKGVGPTQSSDYINIRVELPLQLYTVCKGGRANSVLPVQQIYSAGALFCGFLSLNPPFPHHCNAMGLEGFFLLWVAKKEKKEKKGGSCTKRSP